jgi:hypothetical protein
MTGAPQQLLHLARPVFLLDLDQSLQFGFIAQSSGRFPADFDLLTAVDRAAFDVVAVGMWATRLRCPSCPQRCCAFAL